MIARIAAAKLKKDTAMINRDNARMLKDEASYDAKLEKEAMVMLKAAAKKEARPVCPEHEVRPTLEDVLADKRMSALALSKEFQKLKAYDASENKNCFVGNSILYHFQLRNLMNVKGKRGSFADTMANETLCAKAWANCKKYASESRPNKPALRMFELWRRTSGAIVFFKPTVAMHVYRKLGATKVLDVCAGWGGRLLAAAAMGIEYTGIDTNTDLRESYDGLIALAGSGRMIWGDALAQDFENLDYDCVLTSPPYANLEVYPHMTPWPTKHAFYKDFLIPLINKCRAHIKPGGKVCFNISPIMYEELLKAGYEPCREVIAMKQQKVQGKDKGDQIYVW